VAEGSPLVNAVLRRGWLSNPTGLFGVVGNARQKCSRARTRPPSVKISFLIVAGQQPVALPWILTDEGKGTP
jgi:hypothetical protein